MLLFNKKVTAAQACELGLVTEVFPDSSFQSEVWTRLKAYAKLPRNVSAQAAWIVMHYCKKTFSGCCMKTNSTSFHVCAHGRLLPFSLWLCRSSWCAGWRRRNFTPWTTQRWRDWRSAGCQTNACRPSWASSRPSLNSEKSPRNIQLPSKINFNLHLFFQQTYILQTKVRLTQLIWTMCSPKLYMICIALDDVYIRDILFSHSVITV